MDAKEVKEALAREARREPKHHLKTGKSSHTEQEPTLGIPITEQRRIAKHHARLSSKETVRLLQSKVYEHRMTALLIMIEHYRKAGPKTRRGIHRTYLAHMRRVNTQDLVDTSAPILIGEHLLDKKDRRILYKLARGTVWEKRAALMATKTFIRHGETDDALRLAEIFLAEQQDPIQEAVGRMLGEIGKRVSQKAENEFLEAHHDDMPHTVLEYATRHLSKEERKRHLNGHGKRR
ncbi:MAG: DNA alkylation repair protein [Candidatus Woesearchaeota archaeon]